MNNNILNWLRIILKERFSSELILEKKNQTLILKTENLNGLIIFDKLQENFLKLKSNINCEKWKPELEGFFSISNKSIFAPTSIPLTLPLIEKEKENYLIHYDILGLAYWSLNRLEEIESDNLDKHKRFDFKSSHAYIHKYLDHPIVDYWFDILSQVIKRLWPKINLKKNKFEIDLSHDVDNPSILYLGKNFHSYLRSIIGKFINGNLNDYKKIVSTYFENNLAISNTDPYNTFEWIMNISEKNNLKNTFNFIFGGSHLLDVYYNIRNKKIRNLIKKISQRNNYIGAHLSYDSYKDNQMINKELNNYKLFLKSNNIKQNNLTTRMHYLKWKSPETLVYLDKAGANLDTSLGYSGSPGFRCGTCHVYTGYDPINHKILDIKVSPLILMDVTLTNNINLNLEDAYDVAIDLKNKCKKVNGKFTLLWHNCNLTNDDKKALFKSLI